MFSSAEQSRLLARRARWLGQAYYYGGKNACCKSTNFHTTTSLLTEHGDKSSMMADHDEITSGRLDIFRRTGSGHSSQSLPNGRRSFASWVILVLYMSVVYALLGSSRFAWLHCESLHRSSLDRIPTVRSCLRRVHPGEKRDLWQKVPCPDRPGAAQVHRYLPNTGKRMVVG